MYYDEDLLLDLRLNILNKYVKKFVITEAIYSHSGNKKKLNFDINRFKKFKDKITYIIVEKEPPNIVKIFNNDGQEKKAEKLILNGMARDYFQRNNLRNGIRDAQDEDLILISDIDEIPRLDDLDQSKIKNNIVIFEQKMFYYKFNLFYEGFIWQGTKGIKHKNLVSPQWLRNIKGKKYPKWRIDTFFSKKKYSNLLFIKNGGWHFTYIKTIEGIKNKLNNFAHHYEFNRSGLNIDDLKKMIEENRAIYDYQVDMKKNKWSGKKKLEKINNSELPKYITSNLEKYKDWLN